MSSMTQATSRDALALTRGLGQSHNDIVTLRVAGGSSPAASINEGDMVLISRCAEVREGDLVSASVTGLGRMLGRYVHSGELVGLRASASDAAESSLFSAAQARIEGKVIVVIRQLEPI